MDEILTDALETGPYDVNCYIFGAYGVDTCGIVDPGGDADRIRQRLQEHGRRPDWLLLTHSHFDHLGGVNDLLSAYPDCRLFCQRICGERIAEPRLNMSVPIAGHAVRLPSPHQDFDEEATLTVGGLQVRALHAPGHAPGHALYHLPEHRILFTGDVLFAGSVGRTDLPGSEPGVMEATLASLQQFSDDTGVFPGHGPSSTIGCERRTNPFLLGIR